MLQEGDKAPDFELSDDGGKKVRLSDLLAGGPVVLYFYPGDFTPVCTREACFVRDHHAELAARGVRVYGVNSASAESHARFREQHGLPFPLLVDPDKKAIRAYGASGPLGLGVRRISYLIGPDGLIKDAAKADLRLGPHKEFIRRVLEAHGIRDAPATGEGENR
jgi:peroxiredoxin Q/BCP